ncbi:oligosaccharide flippase family protein [Vibrio vulnificus]|nr:oligosaccharide flippase family protein [Vibrio vulnificus]HAS6329552.1 oligosaccharide flippase family protein [Vibrio vulnificus]HDY7567191.1 oligosaccharide flippase family protein [Vibrio vulnificus]
MKFKIKNEMLYGFVSNIVGNALMFLTTIYLTRTYSTEVYGEFRWLSTFVAFFVLIFMLGRDNYIIYYSQVNNGRDDKIKEQFYHSVIFFCFVTIVLCFFSESIISFAFKNEVSIKSYYLSVVMLPLWGAFNMTLAMHKISENIKFMFLLSNLIQRVARLAAFLILSIICFSSESLYVSMITSQVVILVYSLCKCKFGLSFKGYKLSTFFDGLKYSVQLGLNAIILIFLSKLDVVMIGHYLGSSDVAIYDTSALLAFVILIPFTTLVKINEVEFNINRINWAKYNGRLKMAIVLSFGIFLLFAISGKSILILFGREYMTGFSALMILSIGYVIQCFLGNPIEMLNMNGFARVSTLVLIFSLFVNYSLNVFLIPSYGLDGAAVATVISIAVYKIIALAFLKKELKISNFHRPSLGSVLIMISFGVFFTFETDFSIVLNLVYGFLITALFYLVSYFYQRHC